MAKAIGLLLFVVAVWTGIEVSTYGLHGAFGGAFAPLLGPAPDSHESVAQRSGSSVERAHRANQDRIDKLIGK
jgi:hypothetical protein